MTRMPSAPGGLQMGVVLTDAAAQLDVGDDIGAAARYAESVGLDSVWAGDHLTMGSVPVLDCTLVLAGAAVATDRILLGTAVLVPALRPLAWAAKQVATLIRMSNGRRLQLGVTPGAGIEDDHRAAGFARAERGRRTDEFLDALPDLLAGRPVTLPGAAAATDVQLAPAVDAPTIWVGGGSTASWRRAARYGDGWLAGLIAVDDFGAGMRAIRDLTDSAGRSPLMGGLVVHAAIDERGGPGRRSEVAASLRAAYGFDRELADRLAVGGSPVQVAEQLRPYVEAGAEHIVVINHVGPWSNACDNLALVREHLRG